MSKSVPWLDHAQQVQRFDGAAQNSSLLNDVWQHTCNSWGAVADGHANMAQYVEVAAEAIAVGAAFDCLRIFPVRGVSTVAKDGAAITTVDRAFLGLRPLRSASTVASNGAAITSVNYRGLGMVAGATAATALSGYGKWQVARSSTLNPLAARE